MPGVDTTRSSTEHAPVALRAIRRLETPGVSTIGLGARIARRSDLALRIVSLAEQVIARYAAESDGRATSGPPTVLAIPRPAVEHIHSTSVFAPAIQTELGAPRTNTATERAAGSPTSSPPPTAPSLGGGRTVNQLRRTSVGEPAPRAADDGAGRAAGEPSLGANPPVVGAPDQRSRMATATGATAAGRPGPAGVMHDGSQQAAGEYRANVFGGEQTTPDGPRSRAHPADSDTRTPIAASTDPVERPQSAPARSSGQPPRQLSDVAGRPPPASAIDTSLSPDAHASDGRQRPSDQWPRHAAPDRSSDEEAAAGCASPATPSPDRPPRQIGVVTMDAARAGTRPGPRSFASSPMPLVQPPPPRNVRRKSDLDADVGGVELRRSHARAPASSFGSPLDAGSTQAAPGGAAAAAPAHGGGRVPIAAERIDEFVDRIERRLLRRFEDEAERRGRS